MEISVTVVILTLCTRNGQLPNAVIYKVMSLNTYFFVIFVGVNFMGTLSHY
jgi:hypothetical protein